MWVAGTRVEIEPPKDPNEVIDNHALSVDGLPLYNIVLELVDLSDALWSHAKIRFPAAAESSNPGPIQIPNTHKIIYDHAKPTTVHSPSCVLLLATRYIDLQRPPKQGIACRHKPACLARIGLPTHGFRILPPSERRPFFTRPPPEILHHIFSILPRGDGSLFAVSLVCRVWWKVALCSIYEDFERGRQGLLHIGRLATTLEDNPTWGRHIKRFSVFCFHANSEAQFRRDALTILKTASNMRWLSVGDVTAVLTGEFIETFCKMTELRVFIQSITSPPRRDVNYSAEKIYLNAAQLTKCLVYWPKLRRVVVYRFGEPHAGDGNEFASAQCALYEISFKHGFVSIAQLRAITASSRGTLHVVELSYIKGIINKELTSWLADFGPNLTSLTLDCDNIFTRSEADELALDATIHMMPKLSTLISQGQWRRRLLFCDLSPRKKWKDEYVFLILCYLI